MILRINITTKDGELLEQESVVVESPEEQITQGHLLPLHDAIHRSFRILAARQSREEEE